MREDARNRDLAQLMVVLANTADDGRPAPCTDPTVGQRWLSEERAEQIWAAGHCAGCPALAACRGYVGAHREAAGVWAGLTPGGRERASRAGAGAP